MRRIRRGRGERKLALTVENNFANGKIFPHHAYSEKVRLFGKTNKNTCSESKKKTGSFEKDQKRKGGKPSANSRKSLC